MRCSCFVLLLITGSVLGKDVAEKKNDPSANERQFVPQSHFHEGDEHRRPQFEHRPREFELVSQTTREELRPREFELVSQPSREEHRPREFELVSQPSREEHLILHQPTSSEENRRPQLTFREAERFEDPRLQDPRLQDPRLQDPRLQDPRLQDPRLQDPRLQDPRLQDPRIHESSLQDTRFHDPRLQDPRLQDPRFRHFVNDVPESLRSLGSLKSAPEEISPSALFKHENTFSLPMSHFSPLRMRENPSSNSESSSSSSSSSSSQSSLSSSPTSLRSGFPTTFFNMPFKAVSVTPFKVTGSQSSSQNLVKTADTESLKETTATQPVKFTFEHPSLRPLSESVFRRPFISSESDNLEIMEHQHRPIFHRPEHFRHPESESEFVLRPRPSQFSRFPSTSHSSNPFVISPDDSMTFGPPISFQISPSANLVDPSKNTKDSSQSVKDDSKSFKQQENAVKSAAIPSIPATGLQFKPFGIAPIQFEHGGTSGRDSLRSALPEEPTLRQPQPGSVPFRPIILRPVKLLSPGGREILKSATASSADDEFKAFMTVSEDDVKESLKGRTIRPANSNFDTGSTLSKPPVRQRPIAIRRPSMIRVRPVPSQFSSDNDESQPEENREETRSAKRPQSSSSQLRHRPKQITPSLNFRSTPNRKKLSSSLVEYRIQPSFVDNTSRRQSQRNHQE